MTDIDSFSRDLDELRARVAALQDPSKQQMAELTDMASLAFENLQTALEELQVADRELRQQNEQLAEAQIELEKERGRYQELFDFAPDGYITSDPLGVVQEANRSASQMLNVAQQELVHKPLAVLVAADDRRLFRTQLSQIAGAGRLDDWELRLLPREREPFTASISLAAVRSSGGTLVGLRWLLRDISARKRAEEELRQAVETLRRQSERLRLMHEIDRAVLTTRSSRDIAQDAVRRLCRLLGCALTCVIMFDFERDEAERVALATTIDSNLLVGQRMPLDDFRIQPEHEHGQLYVVRDLRSLSDPPTMLRALTAEGMRSLVSAPLMIQGQLIGALNLADDGQGLLEADKLDAVREVADSLSVALQDARLLTELHARGEQLADLSHRLVEVQESERRSIAHELHDEVGQGLTALLAGLGLLERQSASSPAALAQIENLKALTSGIMEKLHRLAVHLRPVALDYLGLSAALQQLAESYAGDGLALDFVAHGLGEHERFAAGLEITVYRLVQEALTNVVRHAQASRAGVLLERRSDSLIVIVEDNGVGFDPTMAAKPNSMGLFGMRERMELLGGRLEIESTPGAGATVIAEIPLITPQPAL